MLALSINQVTKTYASGTEALKGISFDVQAGEFFALLGPNGSGKSTLINIIAGPTKKSSGQISIHGIDIDEKTEEAKMQIGIVPQEIVFDSFFTINETLLLQSGYYGVKNNQDWIDEVLTNLNLIDKKHSKTRALSGGMKRRLLIAKALVHKPKILFLDEPTAGVDVELRHSLWDYVRKLNQGGMTIFLTTHYLEEAEQLCDRVAIINKGELIKLQPTKELMRSAGPEKRLLVSFHQDIAAENQTKLAKFKVELVDQRTLAVQFLPEQTQELLRALSECSQIDDIRTEEQRLEDIFIRLTSNHNA